MKTYLNKHCSLGQISHALYEVEDADIYRQYWRSIQAKHVVTRDGEHASLWEGSIEEACKTNNE